MSTYIDAVHQLNDLGAVFTQVVTGTSQDGFDAEWRLVELMTVEGGLINRAEFFDETDLDAALAKFEQLSRPAPQLENAASQAYMRFQACFAARDWDAMDEALADGVFHDDRRRMVGAGLREGRDAVRADTSALAEIGVKRMTSDTIATRGRRLILTRSRASGRDQRPDAFRTDVLNIAEINAEDEIAALITFDSNDFDGAFEELDARTSPAKRPPTHTRGLSSCGPAKPSSGARSPRRHRTGSTSTTADWQRSRPVISSRTPAPLGIKFRTSASASSLSIG